MTELYITCCIIICVIALIGLLVYYTETHPNSILTKILAKIEENMK